MGIMRRQNKGDHMELPTDLDAEATLLGRMLTNINVVNDAFDSLTPEDFFSPNYRAIFAAMHLLYKENSAIEPESIIRIIQEHFPQSLDIPLIYGLELHSADHIDDASHFISAIRENSMRRRLMSLGSEIIALSSKKGPSLGQLENDFSKRLADIFGHNQKETTIKLGDAYEQEYRNSGLNFLQWVQKKQEDSIAGISTLTGYSSGFKKIDNLLDGLNKGHLVIIGARPGVGKTTFISNIIKNMSLDGIRVGYFSLEANIEDAQMSFACIMSEVESYRVKKGLIDSEEYTRLTCGTADLREAPIFIDASSGLKLNQVRARTRRMISSCGVQAIFIDYFGEIGADGRFPNKQEEMQVVSRGIRAIAKDFNIPVICVAQLNRDSEKGNRVPIKSDLRESGQIEADAHSILLLHRPDQDDPNNHPGVLNVHIVKNRYGSEGRVSLNFEKNIGKLTELEQIFPFKEKTQTNYV